MEKVVLVPSEIHKFPVWEKNDSKNYFRFSLKSNPVVVVKFSGINKKTKELNFNFNCKLDNAKTNDISVSVNLFYENRLKNMSVFSADSNYKKCSVTIKNLDCHRFLLKDYIIFVLVVESKNVSDEELILDSFKLEYCVKN